MIRAEGGFSLPELLTTLWIGLVVIAAALGLMEFTMKRAGDVERQVDSLRRARLAMDEMTRQLRSQVCLNTLDPPLRAADRGAAPGGLREELWFYADLSDGSPDPRTGDDPRPPELHTLRYEPGEQAIYEDVRYDDERGTEIHYASTPDRTRRLIAEVQPVPGHPIFAYYAFSAATPPEPTELLAPPLSSAELRRVARIEIRFDALAAHSTEPTRGSTVLHDQVYVRAADPHDESPIPTCA